MRCSAACVRVDALVAVLVALGSSAVARAEVASGPASFSDLLRRFAAMPGLEARFREERHIALLEAPLSSEGTLHFAPPGTLVRRIESPSPATVVIDGGRLRYGEAGRTEEIDLDANPLVRHFVESFVHLLGGDEAALRRLYDVTFTPGPEGRWEVLFLPRSEAMRSVLAQVRVSGQGIVIRQMRILEATGDEAVTTFTQVDPARRYSAAELARLARSTAP